MHASPLRIARPSLAPMSRALPAAAGRGSWLRGSASGASGPAKFVATVAGVAALRCQRLRRGGAASAVGQRRLVALAPPWRAARGAATASAAAPEAAPVRAPANDQRGYRVLQLENGLQALLASDPNTDHAAAALSVRCGTFQDTDGRPGLAHFHEHMLFLGTEKYPREDEYRAFLNEHGGDSNAFTMNEYTTYYFKVSDSALDSALDRFADTFARPAFTPSCVEREMRSVDSESSNYSTEDTWRLLQVLKTSASEDHPFSRFDVGNLSTLGADDLGGARAELVEWNKLHYQAGAMKLCVVGRASLDDLQKTVLDKFGPIRAGAGVGYEYSTLPWPAEKLGRRFSCVPLKEARTLSVCWPLPPQSAHLFAKPELYISHVLGHEGEGSLHAVLNQMGWVDQLSAGPSQPFSDSQLFAVNISLTPEGDSEREKVLALLFQYVDLVRSAGPQEATFREIAALQEIEFAHKEDSPLPDDFAASAAMALFKYPPEEALRGPFAVDEWKPEVIQEYLDMLRPDRSLIFVTSSAFVPEASAADAAANGWRTEKWYGARFREEPIGDAQLSAWSQAPQEGDEASSALRLPEPNRFIPQDFSLISASSGSAPTAKQLSKLPTEVTPPALLSDSALARLWHKMDLAYSTPREYVLAYAHLPAYRKGPRNVVLMRLFCSVVSDDLNAVVYPSSVAGLGYTLEFTDGLSMTFGGFSDKLPELLAVVLERMNKVLADFEREPGQDEAAASRAEELLDKVEVSRQLLIQDYRNFTREEPWSVCNYYISQLMLHGVWHLDEYVQALADPFSLDDIAKAVRDGVSEIHVEGLVHGNVAAQAAKSVAERVVRALQGLGSSSSAMAEIPKHQVTRLPVGETLLEFDLAAVNPSQENSCTQNIYQVGGLGEDATRDAALALVCQIANTSAYQRLRTEEQLGYIVQAGVWAEQHVAGLSVIVQGNRLSPSEADARMEAWIQDFGGQLERITPEEFANHVRSAVTERTQRFAQMMQETSRHWHEILSRQYRFDRIAKSVEALKAVRQDDLVALFRERIAADGPERRKLSVHIIGTSAGEHRAPGPKLTSLQEIRDFQGTAEVFPDAVRAPLPEVR